MILALNSPELEIVGITTVSGNVKADQGAKNALKVLKLMNREDIPVYIGEEVPLERELALNYELIVKHGQISNLK